MPSSVIRYFDYHEVRHELVITFQTGAVYKYHDVPEEIYIGLQKARSKGKYFNKRISGTFSFERLSPPD
ncbi:lysyl-tRNA synthetase, class 2 [Parapedobacter composti]|uniref:Lysyl-tRNA synthetase, class 2 n=1 Tax=Parapedobacter composti TaxID=623281 RepID=A0A1I1IQJ5_9SPHI|nr:KTSC domain-containing protein [Parapedobacter composti]SFC36023.1 lysyl-tRNA synthetase, class 2 [Parapedobacter composti]